MATPSWITDDLRTLFEEIVRCETKNEVAAFMRDVATIRELEEMAARWKAAKMINEGTSYRDISEATGLSTTTVSRVAYWIKYGEGGYRKALKNS